MDVITYPCWDQRHAMFHVTLCEECIRCVLCCGLLWFCTVRFYSCAMMTSSNGNIFRVTGHLCGEFTGHRWIPLTKASDAELWCFLWSAPESTVEETIVRLVIWDASRPLWRHCNSSGSLHWQQDNDTIAAVPVKHPGRICVNLLLVGTWENIFSTGIGNITTTKPSKRKRECISYLYCLFHTTFLMEKQSMISYSMFILHDMCYVYKVIALTSWGPTKRRIFTCIFFNQSQRILIDILLESVPECSSDKSVVLGWSQDLPLYQRSNTDHGHEV